MWSAPLLALLAFRFSFIIIKGLSLILLYNSTLHRRISCLTTTLFIVLQRLEVTAPTIGCPVTTSFNISRMLGIMKLHAADFSKPLHQCITTMPSYDSYCPQTMAVSVIPNCLSCSTWSVIMAALPNAPWKNRKNVLALIEILLANFCSSPRKCSNALFIIASMSKRFDNRWHLLHSSSTSQALEC